jgi:branched-chain amino acid transport system substrate-binding protein
MAVVLLLPVFTGCVKEKIVEVPTKPTEVVFGALLSLTGDSSSSGECGQAALEIAVEDVNAYFSAIGSEIRVRLIVEDTKTEPAVALEKLKSLAGKGIRVIIGPENSAEVAAVKAYADENGILLLSQSSTAPSLAIAGDNVFRFCPDDNHQAKAVARMMWEDGIRVIVPMWRGDLWGDELSNATKGGFEELGGRVLDGIRYTPVTKDFSTELESLNSKVGQAIAQHGDADAVGVYLIAFDEVVPIFIQAGEQNAIFSMVKWYGSDGTAMSNALVSTPRAAQFAVMTGFPNPIFGVVESEKYEAISEQISAKIGRTPDAYALAAYDALWVLTIAYIEAGEHDCNTLKVAVLRVAESYRGTTGWTSLNEAGDRLVARYDFWAVREDNGTFRWKRVATYLITPDILKRYE